MKVCSSRTEDNLTSRMRATMFNSERLNIHIKTSKIWHKVMKECSKRIREFSLNSRKKEITYSFVSTHTKTFKI